MGCSWQRVPLGATGSLVTPLGLGASYGLEARDVERAIDRGINYIYWGAYRRPSFATAIRNLGPARRQDLVIVVQTYTRVASLMRRSLERALRRLGTDHVDGLLLGWWNQSPPRGIVEAALALRAAGKARWIQISCHHRPSFQGYIEDRSYDSIMVRYNAAHPGAETEVFPHLATRRVGVVAYTATRWGTLLDPRHLPPGEPVPRASDCYRFALGHAGVDVCLAGPSDAGQLDEALAALDRGPLADDELAWLRRVGAHVHKHAQSRGAVVGLGDRALRLVDRLSHAWED
jgi:aryl-alcohol dehydrogenase-like predicted oxidoreductase